MLQLPKDDRDLLRGVIDMHVHAHPCLYDRPFDEIELARQARDCGYRALVFKSIYVTNADRVEFVRQAVPGIDLFGGIVLNHAMGGLNAEAVHAAIGFGAKVVWMPSVNAHNHVRHFGAAVYPWKKHRTGAARATRTPPPAIRLVDDDDRLVPAAVEILEIAAAGAAVVATGHIGADEIFAILRAAKEVGLEKVVCTHVGWNATDWSLDEARRMADQGAFLEFCINPCMPARLRRDPADFAAIMKAVGPERCILSTDLGQHENAHPIEGYRMFIRMLLSRGIDERSIHLMARENPRRLLDLPEQAPSAPAGP